MFVLILIFTFTHGTVTTLPNLQSLDECEKTASAIKEGLKADDEMPSLYRIKSTCVKVR